MTIKNRNVLLSINKMLQNALLNAGLIRYGFAVNRDSNSFYVSVLWKNDDNSKESWITTFSTLDMQWSNPSMCWFDVGLFFPKSVQLDGCLYWLSHSSYSIVEDVNHIVCYNCIENKFYSIKLPHCSNYGTWYLSVLNGCIAVTSGVQISSLKRDYEVWTKNDNVNYIDDWVKQFPEDRICSGSQYLGYSDGRLIFSSKTFKLQGRDYEFGCNVGYCVGSQMECTKKITSFLPYDFLVENFFEFYPSLTKF